MRLPVAPPNKRSGVTTTDSGVVTPGFFVDDPSPSLTLAPRCAAGAKLGGRVGVFAASKELWGAGVRSTKATQLHSIGQWVGWVGCAPGSAWQHRLATASPWHYKCLNRK